MPEWDEQGRPTYSGPTYGAAQAQEWDEDGNPVSDAQPSAFDRFMEGAGQYLNPVKVVRDMGEAARPVDVPGEFGQAVEAIRGGDYGRAARHVGAAVSPFAGPLGPALVPAARMVPAAADAQSGQLIKAYDAAAAGEYGRAVGHGLAGITPLVGPASAAFGERINSGDVAGGLGEATGLLASSYLPVGAAKVAPAAGRAAVAAGRAVASAGRAVGRNAGPVAGVVAGGATLATTGSPFAAIGAADLASRGAGTLKALFSRGPAVADDVRAAVAQARSAEAMAEKIAAAKARNAPAVERLAAQQAGEAQAASDWASGARSARLKAEWEAKYGPINRPAPEAAPAPAAVAPEAAPVVAEAAAPVQARPIPPSAQPVPMTPSRGGLPPGLATQLDQEMAARQAAAAPVESPKWWQEWAANEVAVTRAQIAELKQAPPTPKTEAAIAQRVKYAEGLIRSNPGLLAQVPDAPGPGPRRFVGADPGYPVPRESWVPPGNGVPPAAAPAAPAAPASAAAEAPRALPAEAVTLAQQIESSAANMIQNTGLSGAQMVQALVEEYRIPPNAAQAMLAEVQKVYPRPATIPGQGPPLSSAPQRGATAAQLEYRAQAAPAPAPAPAPVAPATLGEIAAAPPKAPRTRKKATKDSAPAPEPDMTASEIAKELASSGPVEPNTITRGRDAVASHYIEKLGPGWHDLEAVMVLQPEMGFTQKMLRAALRSMKSSGRIEFDGTGRIMLGSDPGYPVPRESWVPPGNGVPPAAAPATLGEIAGTAETAPPATSRAAKLPSMPRTDHKKLIAEHIKKGDYRHYALRRMTDADAPKVGDQLGPSYAWDDGVSTGEILDGTAATLISEGADGVAEALKQSTQYRGPLVLLGSDYLGDGLWPTVSEPLQTTMRNPVVVAVLTKK